MTLNLALYMMRYPNETMAEDRVCSTPTSISANPTGPSGNNDRLHLSFERRATCLVEKQHSRRLCLTVFDRGIRTSFDNADAAAAREFEENLALHFDMESRLLDIMQNETMDWREWSRASMPLPGDMMRELALLERSHQCPPIIDLALLRIPGLFRYPPTLLAKEPLIETSERNDPDRQIFAKMVALQLLASCFTSPKNIKTLTLPSGWYLTKHHIVGNGEDIRHVSSLRQHAQWRLSPAHGHHARTNSAVSLWPDQDREPSLEELLPEDVSRKLLLRRREPRAALKDAVTWCSSQGISDNRTQSQIKKQRRRLCPGLMPYSRMKKRMSLSQLSGPSKYGPSLMAETLEDQGRHAATLRAARGLRHRCTGDTSHCCRLKPVVRSEVHPVFIQPVKAYVMRRRRASRSSRHSESPVHSSGNRASVTASQSLDTKSR